MPSCPNGFGPATTNPGQSPFLRWTSEWQVGTTRAPSRREHRCMFQVRITDEIDEASATELRNAVNEFNVAATGFDDGRSLGCVVRDDDGRLVAGLDGFTW